MELSRVCPLSDSLDSPNHGKFFFWGRINSYSSFQHMMNKCVIHKCIKRDWNLNQYSDPSNLTKEFDFNSKDSEKEIDDVYRKLLAYENCPDPDPLFTKQLRKVTQSYGIVMERKLAKLDHWLKMRQTTIHNLQETLQKCSFLKGATTGITLMSATLEFVVGFCMLMQRLFHFDMNSKYEELMRVATCLSFIWSLDALSHSNDSMNNTIRVLMNEKFFLRDIETVFHRSNWIDEELQELFPHGIDLKLVMEQAFDADGNLVEQWEPVVCSAIISTNVKKDEKLKYDMKFLASVKAFVRSTAAQIWIKGIKLRSLMDYSVQNMNSLLNKKSINRNEVFVNLNTIQLYPFFFNMFCGHKKLNFLWRFLSAIFTALSLKAIGGFEDVEATSTKLQKDYKHVRKITRNLQAMLRLVKKNVTDKLICICFNSQTSFKY